MNEKISKVIVGLINEANGSYRDIKSQVIRSFEDLTDKNFIGDVVENKRFANFVENSIDEFEFLKSEKEFGNVLDSIVGKYVSRIQSAIDGNRYDETHALKSEFMKNMMALKKADLGIEDDFLRLWRMIRLRFPSSPEEAISFYLRDKERRIEDLIRKKHDGIIDAIIGQVLELGTHVRVEDTLIPEGKGNDNLEEKPIVSIFIGPDMSLYTSFPMTSGKFDMTMAQLSGDGLSSIMENSSIRWIKFDEAGVWNSVSKQEIESVLSNLLGEECKVTVVSDQDGVYSYKIDYLSKDALPSDYLI